MLATIYTGAMQKMLHTNAVRKKALDQSWASACLDGQNCLAI
jgi:hypothetical protein